MRDPSNNFTVRLSDEDRKALARSAKRRQRTAGAVIRQLITEDDDTHNEVLDHLANDTTTQPALAQAS
jgi:predicted transcriptional regulator